jgi:DEAD/DEAH box helicase domain-containing protein
MAEAFGGRAREILTAALELVTECPCEEGCPSCIGPRDPNEEIDQNPKARVASFLRSWVVRTEE